VVLPLEEKILQGRYPPSQHRSLLLSLDMTRRSRLWIAVSLFAIALVVGALAALPVAVRWMAESRIEDMTGLDASIADVDLHAHVTVEIAGLDLGQAWSYVPRELALGFEGGAVTMRAEGTYDAETGARASAHATPPAASRWAPPT
jgi:hypothetical protein